MLKEVQHWSEDFSDGKNNFGTKLTGHAEVVKDTNGGYCLVIEKEGYSEKKYSLQFRKGHVYKISMVLKANQAQNIFFMKFMDDTNKHTPIELKSTNTIPLTTEYKEFSLEYTADKDIDEGSVYFQFWEGGGGYVSKISLSELAPSNQEVKINKTDLEWVELYHYFYDGLYDYSLCVKTHYSIAIRYKLFVDNAEIQVEEPNIISNCAHSERFKFTQGAQLRLEASIGDKDYQVMFEGSYEALEDYFQNSLVRIVFYSETDKREIGFNIPLKLKEKRYNIKIRKNHIYKISVTNNTPIVNMKLMDETNKNSPIELKSTSPKSTENQGCLLEYIADKDIAQGSIYLQLEGKGNDLELKEKEDGYCEVLEDPL